MTTPAPAAAPRPCSGGRHTYVRAAPDVRAHRCRRCGHWRPFNIDGTPEPPPEQT